MDAVNYFRSQKQFLRKYSVSLVSNIQHHVQKHTNHCWFPEHSSR